MSEGIQEYWGGTGKSRNISTVLIYKILLKVKKMQKKREN